MKLTFLFFIFCTLASSMSFSKTENSNKKSSDNTSYKSANYLFLKSSLEEVISKNWSQDLSTIVDKDQFKLSANFVLQEKTSKDVEPNGPLYNDLELGHIDAQELLNLYQATNADAENEFVVKKAEIKIGLNPEISDKNRQSLNDYLNKKIKNEFGKTGTLEISNFEGDLKSSPFKKPTLLEQLKSFQIIVGSLFLAIALILGSLIYGLMSGLSGKEGSSDLSASVSVNSKSEITPSEDTVSGSSTALENESLFNQITENRDRIKEVSLGLVDELEVIVAEWCDQGQSGLKKLACFTEVASSVVGKVIIPEDVKSSVADLFSSMSDLETSEKLDLYQKTYWDLVASKNLGVSSLHEPFSFIADASMDTLNQVLSTDDSKNQAIIAMYMPDNARSAYLSDMKNEDKMQILESAAKLSSVTEGELHSLEDKYAEHFNEKIDESAISMSHTLNKIVDALSMIDSCKLLPDVNGDIMVNFKNKTPHVAFLSEWSVESLSYLIKRITNEELFSYLKVAPQMTTVFMSLVSPKTKEIVEDDLRNSSNEFNEKNIENGLSSLNQRIVSIFKNDELQLSKTLVKDNNVVKIAA